MYYTADMKKTLDFLDLILRSDDRSRCYENPMVISASSISMFGGWKWEFASQYDEIELEGEIPKNFFEAARKIKKPLNYRAVLRDPDGDAVCRIEFSCKYDSDTSHKPDASITILMRHGIEYNNKYGSDIPNIKNVMGMADNIFFNGNSSLISYCHEFEKVVPELRELYKERDEISEYLKENQVILPAANDLVGWKWELAPENGEFKLQEKIPEDLLNAAIKIKDSLNYTATLRSPDNDIFCSIKFAAKYDPEIPCEPDGSIDILFPKYGIEYNSRYGSNISDKELEKKLWLDPCGPIGIMDENFFDHYSSMVTYCRQVEGIVPGLLKEYARRDGLEQTYMHENETNNQEYKKADVSALHEDTEKPVKKQFEPTMLPKSVSPVKATAETVLSYENRRNIASQLAYIQKSILNHTRNGSLCCLPDAQGQVDTAAVKNPVTGYIFTGLNQILAKQFVKDNNVPAMECVTFEQVQAAGTRLFGGARGFSAITVDKNNRLTTTRYFSTAQALQPEKITALAQLNDIHREQNRQKQNEQALAIAKERGGDARLYGYQDARKQTSPSLSEIKCTSVTPAGYIGQYLAAVSSGAQFSVKPEQAAAFRKNLIETLSARNTQGHTNPFKLMNISKKANEVCRETLKKEYARQKKQRAAHTMER